jgi:hypothetical protein
MDEMQDGCRQTYRTADREGDDPEIALMGAHKPMGEIRTIQ